MKHYPPRPRKSRTPALQIPPFHAVPVRIRADGWTPLRQAEFIGHLAETRSVTAAARFVGMGRESAHRLRVRARERGGAEGFCAAWDMALARRGGRGADLRAFSLRQAAREALRASRKVTLADLEWRVETGIWQVILRGGRYVGVRQSDDNAALLMLIRRIDAIRARAGAEWQ